jgi:hypothetical protein
MAQWRLDGCRCFLIAADEPTCVLSPPDGGYHATPGQSSISVALIARNLVRTSGTSCNWP